MAIVSMTGSGSNCFHYHLGDFPYRECDAGQLIEELKAAGLSWTSVDMDRSDGSVKIRFDPVPPLPQVDAVIRVHHPATLFENTFKNNYPRHYWALEKLSEPEQTTIRRAIREGNPTEFHMTYLWMAASKFEQGR